MLGDFSLQAEKNVVSVPIKSKYMQSAAKRKTPAVGKTPSTIGMTPAANNLSNRQKIEEVCRQYNFN